MVTGQLWRLGPDISSEIFRAERPRSPLQCMKEKTKNEMELKNHTTY